MDLAGVDADLSGIVAAGKAIANTYRGVENPFGHVQQFIDGINIDNRTGTCHVYVCHTPNNFADDTMVNYIDTGHAPGFGDTDNYIKDMAFLGQDCTFYPNELGGSSTTYIPDYHYNSPSSWRVILTGGHMTNSTFAGLGFLTAQNSSSTYISFTSARSAA